MTCPETGHLEEVELERTSCGLVVSACSRFDPASEVACPRECAKRLDRRDRREHDLAERVLVAVPRRHGRTQAIAEMLASFLRRDGFTVELADLDAAGPPPPEDYDAVVIGSPVTFGRPSQDVTRYVRSHRTTLSVVPAFFFSVSEAPRASSLVRPLARLTAATGWHPTNSAAFGTSLYEATDIQDFALAIGDEVPAVAPAAALTSI